MAKNVIYSKLVQIPLKIFELVEWVSQRYKLCILSMHIHLFVLNIFFVEKICIFTFIILSDVIARSNAKCAIWTRNTFK